MSKRKGQREARVEAAIAATTATATAATAATEGEARRCSESTAPLEVDRSAQAGASVGFAFLEAYLLQLPQFRLGDSVCKRSQSGRRKQPHPACGRAERNKAKARTLLFHKVEQAALSAVRCNGTKEREHIQGIVGKCPVQGYIRAQSP